MDHLDTGHVTIELSEGPDTSESDEEEESDAKSCIQRHIKKRECTTFVEDSSSNGTRCQCGHLRESGDHESVALDMVTHWNSAQHSSEYPTDAFGEITLKPTGRWKDLWFSQYLRLSWDSDPCIVYDLMTRHAHGAGGFRLPPPNLVVSVVGGEGSAEVKPWVQEFLKQGLVKALQRTALSVGQPGGAWILAEGLHEGIGRCVGEAVRDHNTVDFASDNRVFALGISPWGLVHNRQQLVNPQGSVLKYSIENPIRDSCCLTNGFEYFLLVDDGSVGCRGGETIFRANLEEHISRRRAGWGDSIDMPFLCMLISGEATMLERVDQSLSNSTAWLVLAGSGGVADLLSDILENPPCTPAELKDRVTEGVRRYFPSEAQTEKLVEQALSIYKNRDLITVYHGEQERPDDFDTVMHKALVRAAKHRASCDDRLPTEAMKLAVHLNRADIAKSELFTNDIKWPDEDLDDCLDDVLVNDKLQFVRLFIEKGFHMPSYLSYSRLEWLYNTVADGTLAEELLQQCLVERQGNNTDTQGDLTLFEVACVLKKLIGDLCRPFYYRVLGLEDFASGRKAPKHANIRLHDDSEYKEETCAFPWTSLFIWSVLQNRSDMAVFCWEQAEDSVLNALSACKILRGMSKLETEMETKLSMTELAQRFEELAHGMLGSTCYQSNEADFFQLLTRKSEVWDTNCFEMGIAVNSHLFFNHDGIESLLSNIWWGDIKKKSNWFKGAPITTFWSNMLMYFLFLLLFAYMLLVDFKPPPPFGPSTTEFVLYFWVFTFSCEEIRQAIFMDNMTWRQSMRQYIKDVWNKYDLAAITLFIVGLICRMFEWSHEFGRCVLCVDYMVFTLRLIQIFAVHKLMGPKIIMVGKMMKDVSLFLFFLGVWIMAYGVANQALLYPYDPNPKRIFRRVLYRPYLHIFGHFPVEEVDVDEQWDMPCTNNVTEIEAGAEPCRSEFSNPLVILLLVIYLLVTNILLINLLIAILSNIVNKVEENSDIYWRFQHYTLIMEYKSRPCLAPPFIILSHLHLFLSFLMRKKQNEPLVPHDSIDGIVIEETVRGVVDWETDQKKKFLAAQRNIQRATDSETIKQMSVNVLKQLTETRDFDQRLKQMSDKVDSVVKQRNESRDIDQRLKQMSDKVDSVVKQLNETRDSLKTEMEKCSKSLTWIMDTLAQSSLAKPPSDTNLV